MKIIKKLFTLSLKYAGVKEKERKKAKAQSVRRYQKLYYMHKDPVSKKWQLVNDFTDYLYSSSSYYEKVIKQYDKLLPINEVLL